MKKIITIIVVLVISITSTTAGNGKSLNSIINKELRIPTSLKENKMNEKVNIQFKITETGKATILNVETTNSELKEYILTQFPKIDFNNTIEKSKGMYSIEINFRVL